VKVKKPKKKGAGAPGGEGKNFSKRSQNRGIKWFEKKLVGGLGQTPKRRVGVRCAAGEK